MLVTCGKIEGSCVVKFKFFYYCGLPKLLAGVDQLSIMLCSVAEKMCGSEKMTEKRKKEREDDKNIREDGKDNYLS